eukprot:CAMPEP_0184855706 /NCGR_PEP_ID=MMETSP0580-20130426/853_1 /TAXON_ID=1118495 /ORGANISM="Dactyliosolen fragilissimus" /LENGTH=600 /DNA_ID=CAMNT_0027350273 /DNA_START=33 /DNA_END=1835 /DNA_ORIENTATION=+
MKLSNFAFILLVLKETLASTSDNRSLLKERKSKTGVDLFHQNGSTRNLLMEGTFEEIAEIHGDNIDDWFGYRVDLSSDGMTVAISGTKMDVDGVDGSDEGKVRVFTYSYSSGTYEQLGPDIEGSSDGEWLGKGSKLSSDGRTLVLGSVYYTHVDDGTEIPDTGKVGVYTYRPFEDEWVLRGQELFGTIAEEQEFGYEVDISLDSKIIAIGAPGSSGIGGEVWAGRVDVYDWNFEDEAWDKRENSLYGDAEEQFGHAVSLSDDGNILAVGSKYGLIDNIEDEWGGDANIFKWNSGNQNWDKRGNTILAPDYCDKFGYRLDLSKDGKYVAVGAYRHDTFYGEDTGLVRVYKYVNSIADWEQVGQDLIGEAAEDSFGRSVEISADGKTVVIGADENDENGPESGHARVYSWNDESNLWVQVGMDLDGEYENDYFGWDVSISNNGEIVAVSGPDHDDDVGHVKIFKYKKSDPEVCYGQFDTTTKKIVLYEDGDKNCLTISKSKNVLLKPCRSKNSFQKWNQHSLGLIRSKKYPDYCLEASGTKLLTANCQGGKGGRPTSWVFNDDGSATSSSSLINNLRGKLQRGKLKVTMTKDKVPTQTWALE